MGEWTYEDVVRMRESFTAWTAATNRRRCEHPENFITVMTDFNGTAFAVIEIDEEVEEILAEHVETLIADVTLVSLDQAAELKAWFDA